MGDLPSNQFDELGPLQHRLVLACRSGASYVGQDWHRLGSTGVELFRCQAFRVYGKRKSLDEPNAAIVFVAVLALATVIGYACLFNRG